MKNQYFLNVCFLLCVLISILFISCNKNDEEDIITHGKASAMINGKLWLSEVVVVDKGDKFTLVMNDYKEIEGSYVPWDDIGIYLAYKKEDTIQRIYESDTILPTAPWLATKVYGSFGTSQYDGDVGCDFYHVINKDSVNNWVRIDKEFGNYKAVWGSFAMHLYRVQSCAYSSYTDTLLITNGRFSFEY